MQHNNAKVLEQLYTNFSKGDIAAVLSACAENITFQISGKSALAGKYTKADFASGFVNKLQEISGGSLQMEVHDILASDRHAVVLVSDHLTKKGEKIQIRSAHVWRFENGKPVAFYEYPRDMYQYDAVWSL